MTLLGTFGSRSWKTKTYASVTWCGGNRQAGGPPIGKTLSPAKQYEGYAKLVGVVDAFQNPVDYLGDSTNHAIRVNTVASSNTVAAITIKGGQVGGSAVQLGEQICTRGVIITADGDNGNSVYVGYSSAVTADQGTATSGLRLKAGNQTPLLTLSDASLLWVIGGASSQNYTITSM